MKYIYLTEYSFTNGRYVFMGQHSIYLSKFEDYNINDIVYYEHHEYKTNILRKNYGLIKCFFFYAGSIYASCFWFDDSTSKLSIQKYKNIVINKNDYFKFGVNITDKRLLLSKEWDWGSEGYKNWEIQLGSMPIEKIKKEDIMNKTVIEMYPKTKDAVVVDKWFGSKLDDPIFAMLLEGKEEKLLQEAIKLEEEEKKK
jgi:hypothetical protein